MNTEKRLCAWVFAVAASAWVFCGAAIAQQSQTRPPAGAPQNRPAANTQAPAPMKDGQVFDDWVASCGKVEGRPNERCVIRQDRVNAQGQRVVRAIAGYFGANLNEPFVVFDLPLGVYLPAGAAFRIDTLEQRPLAFESCSVDGCRTVVPLDVPTLQAMRNGQVLRIGILAKPGGETVTMEVSLKGFAAGYSGLRP